MTDRCVVNMLTLMNSSFTISWFSLLFYQFIHLNSGIGLNSYLIIMINKDPDECFDF